MVDTSQAWGRGEATLILLARSGVNIIIEQRRVTGRLWKEALREVSLSAWLSFIKGIQAVHNDVLTSMYITFGFGALQNFCFGISKLLKNLISHIW